MLFLNGFYEDLRAAHILIKKKKNISFKENKEQGNTTKANQICKKALCYVIMTYIMIHLSQNDALKQYLTCFSKSAFSINTKIF